MILWLWRLIWGTPAVRPCEHNWEHYESIKVYGRFPNGTKTEYPVYSERVLRCERCGSMMNHRVG